jgi:hypothetical protein
MWGFSGFSIWYLRYVSEVLLRVAEMLKERYVERGRAKRALEERATRREDAIVFRGCRLCVAIGGEEQSEVGDAEGKVTTS